MNIRKNVDEMSELLADFQRYLQDEERSPATVDKYLRDVKAFVKYLDRMGGNRKGDAAAGIKDLDKEKVREYKQFLKEQYKITSANSMPVSYTHLRYGYTFQK